MFIITVLDSIESFFSTLFWIPRRIKCMLTGHTAYRVFSFTISPSGFNVCHCRCCQAYYHLERPLPMSDDDTAKWVAKNMPGAEHYRMGSFTDISYKNSLSYKYSAKRKLVIYPTPEGKYAFRAYDGAGEIIAQSIKPAATPFCAHFDFCKIGYMADMHQPDYEVVYVGIAPHMHKDDIHENLGLHRTYAEEDPCREKAPRPSWTPGPHVPGTTDGTPDIDLRWWFMGGGR